MYSKGALFPLVIEVFDYLVYELVNRLLLTSVRKGAYVLCTQGNHRKESEEPQVSKIGNLKYLLHQGEDLRDSGNGGRSNLLERRTTGTVTKLPGCAFLWWTHTGLLVCFAVE